MLSHLVIAVLISCVFNVQSTVGEDCSVQSIMLCFSALESFSKQLIPNDWDAQCRELRNGFDCIERKVLNCRNMGATFQDKKAVINKLLDSLCSQQSVVRKLYEEHRKCYGSINEKPCTDKFMEVMQRPVNDQTQNAAKSCCAVKQLENCVTSILTKQCDANATRMPQEIMKIISEPNPQIQQCKETDKKCQPYLFTNSGNSLSVSIVFLFIVTIVSSVQLSSTF